MKFKMEQCLVHYPTHGRCLADVSVLSFLLSKRINILYSNYKVGHLQRLKNSKNHGENKSPYNSTVQR